MDVNIDPAVRQAVHELDCAEHGHQVTFSSAFRYDRVEPGGHEMKLAGPDAETLPHLRCRHCGGVALILPFARSYEEALNAYADATPPAPILMHSAHVEGRKSDG